jgi:hypothetical protein
VLVRQGLDAIARLRKRTTIDLLWVPAHCGIFLNEVADWAAKRGAKGTTSHDPPSATTLNKIRIGETHEVKLTQDTRASQPRPSILDTQSDVSDDELEISDFARFDAPPAILSDDESAPALNVNLRRSKRKNNSIPGRHEGIDYSNNIRQRDYTFTVDDSSATD